MKINFEKFLMCFVDSNSSHTLTLLKLNSLQALLMCYLVQFLSIEKLKCEVIRLNTYLLEISAVMEKLDNFLLGILI